MKTTERFSNRVENYIKYRPGYPNEVVTVLSKLGQLDPTSVVADIGSGTGLLTRLFLERGHTVYGVEPNQAMREAGDIYLVAYKNFISVAATAEETTLDRDSVDLVVAGQAFHWFDLPTVKQEFRRILKPDGWVALIWNSRLLEATPFLQAYEALLHEHGVDYAAVNHNRFDDKTLLNFFDGEMKRFEIDNEQIFDFHSLKGRLLSSSYAPERGHPNHQPMLDCLAEIFETHQQDNTIEFLYKTTVYLGQLSS